MNIPGPSVYDDIYKKISSKWYIRRNDLYKKVASLIPKSSKILDIGCGSGYLSTLISDDVISYTGIDFSKVAIEQANRNKTDKIKFIMGDIFEVNWGEYDTVVLMEILEHIDKDIEILSKIKPGAFVILTVPNNEIAREDGKPKGYPIHRRIYTTNNVYERYDNIIKIENIIILRHWIILTGYRRG